MKQAEDIVVKLDATRNGGPIDVATNGIRFGDNLAVTPFVFRYSDEKQPHTKRGEWTVTHIPTGRRIGPVMSKKSAMTFARLLSGKDVWDFFATTKKEVPRQARTHFMKCIKELDVKDNGK